VLGCLVEKQLTTPQQYPLTLNALTAATNQTTNRDPVVSLDDDAVLAALDELRSRHLIRVVLPSHGRSVKRYRQVLDEAYGLDAPRYGLLAALLLRGAQTVGELRARTERMVDLPTIGDVEENLTVLAEHPEGLARLLPRRPGQKEDRWQQIVAAPWGGDATTGGDEAARPRAGSSPDGAPADAGRGDDRIGYGRGGEDELDSSGGTVPSSTSDQEAELEELRSELAALRDAVSVLREEFDSLRHGLGE
jgi:uncharacterized protein YceH (UPF0502 family)